MADGPDFIPYSPASTAPPPFIPYQPVAKAAPKDQGTLTGKIPSEGVDAMGRQTGPSQDFISRKVREAENLTVEGAKQHPIENFVGQTAKRLGEFGKIAGTMAMLLPGGEELEGAEALPGHAEHLTAPNEGKIAAGPAPAQAYSRFGVKTENAAPNAAGRMDVVAPGTSTGGTMKPTVGATAPLRPEQKLLPPGPAPKLNAFGEPIPELAPSVGRSVPAAETPRPQLSESQINETRAQIAKLNRQARAANQKQSSARGWQVANRWMQKEQAYLEKSAQLERDLGIGKAARPALEPLTKEQQLSTYNAATPEQKAEIDEMAKLYPRLQSFEKTEFERENNLNSGTTTGLPLKEKLARSVTGANKTAATDWASFIGKTAEPQAEEEAVPAFVTSTEELGQAAEREPGDEMGKTTGPTISTPKEAIAAPGPSAPIRTQVGKTVNAALKVEPLNPKVPLREQIGQTAAPAPNPKAELEAKYPDRAVRQMVHANGENIVLAVGDNPELMREIHDLTKVDLSRAAQNGGFDLGQRSITSSKFAGEGGITRQQVFDRLLEMGHTPRDIVRLAKTPTPEIDRLNEILEGVLDRRKKPGFLEKYFGPERRKK